MNANKNSVTLETDSTSEESFHDIYPIEQIKCGSPTEDIVDSEDEDTCTLEELDKFFKHKYKIHDETAVTNDNSYVLSLARDDLFTCIAAGLSDGSVRLFEINTERGLYIQPPIKDNRLSICGVRFVDETPNLLLVGTTNCLVRLLDLRTRNEVARFQNIPSNNSEPRDILSFDRNSNSRLLAMGTTQRHDNVNLLFYDLRSYNKLFGYFDSHQDDLTSLRFHSRNPNLLCSGSTDCLINIFDVQKNEDDAILTTINTLTTVHKVNWHKNKYGRDIISCVSHINSLKAYEFDGDIIADFDRLKITETIKRKSESNCNLIDCFSTADNNMMILAGSKNGSVLRSCKVQNDQLLPYANFEGSNQLIRDSIFDCKTNILITAGESGFVTLWTPVEWNSTTPSKISYPPRTSLKIKTKTSNKVNPY